MKKLFSNKYLVLIARIFLGFIFIFAAIEKISDPAAFAKVIYNYKLFPEIIINISAVVIPWIELVAGIFLLFGVFSKENATIIISLLIVFIILIAVSMIRELNIECGCFGTSAGSKVGWTKILENTGLLILGFIILFFDEGKLSLTGITKRIADNKTDFI